MADEIIYDFRQDDYDVNECNYYVTVYGTDYDENGDLPDFSEVGSAGPTYLSSALDFIMDNWYQELEYAEYEHGLDGNIAKIDWMHGNGAGVIYVSYGNPNTMLY